MITYQYASPTPQQQQQIALKNGLRRNFCFYLPTLKMLRVHVKSSGETQKGIRRLIEVTIGLPYWVRYGLRMSKSITYLFIHFIHSFIFIHSFVHSFIHFEHQQQMTHTLTYFHTDCVDITDIGCLVRDLLILVSWRQKQTKTERGSERKKEKSTPAVMSG